MLFMFFSFVMTFTHFHITSVATLHPLQCTQTLALIVHPLVTFLGFLMATPLECEIHFYWARVFFIFLNLITFSSRCMTTFFNLNVNIYHTFDITLISLAISCSFVSTQRVRHRELFWTSMGMWWLTFFFAIVFFCG